MGNGAVKTERKVQRVVNFIPGVDFCYNVARAGLYALAGNEKEAARSILYAGASFVPGGTTACTVVETISEL